MMAKGGVGGQFPRNLYWSKLLTANHVLRPYYYYTFSEFRKEAFVFAFLYFYKSFVRQGLDVVMASCPKTLVLKLR